ncbi:MAG: hypothetical protein COA58_10065 [Bacteroidetes bacterium]|nr:MAG: hypothetical protein COA58_10065 [Bacteroidota bacterium]
MLKYAVITLSVIISGCLQNSIPVVDIASVDVKSKAGLAYVNNELFTGRLEKTNMEGLLISSSSYKKGKQDGLTRKWYNSGQLKESRQFLDNKKTGRHLGYWPSGVPSFAFSFNEGKYIDTLREWYPNGQLYRLEYYQNGEQTGRQKAWRKNGELYLNYDVKNGRKYGNAGIKHCKSIWNEVGTAM